MGKTEKMFDEMLNETESFFVPTEDKKKEKSDFAPNVSGEFLGHMQEATCKEVSWVRDGKTFKAVVYNYQFVIAPQNSINAYTLNNGEKVDGDKYVGRNYRNAGIFRFLEAKEGDEHVSNPEGNKSYLWFCQTLGKEIPRKVVQLNGQDVEVQIETVLRVEDAVFDAGRKEDIFALQFVGKKKLMVLNATNRKAIVKMFGSITADWRGKKISLYIRDGIRMGKEVKRGIRVRYTGPTESEKLSESL